MAAPADPPAAGAAVSLNARFPGLTPAGVEANRRAHGHNVLTPPAREPWWKQWLAKFADPVIRILIIAAAIQIGVGFYKGEYIEGLAIVVAILLATTLAFVNEYRAAREFDVLNQVNDDVPVKAVRGGQFVTVPKRDVVVGDVLLIETGEELPADGAVVEAVALSVAESSLTGEALPVKKGPAGSFPESKDYAYPVHKAYRGTMVADGFGVVRVEAVGDRTELGRLGRKASEQTDERTPLNEQLDKLSKWIGIVGLGIAAATFFALVARGAVVGDLRFTGGQWAVVGILFAGVAVALHRVWLKITLEGLAAFGQPVRVPEWLDEDSLPRWLVAVGAGGLLAAAGLGIAAAAGVLPPTVGEWLPAEGASALLNYFMIAVVIIVVAVPEGLAMSVTLSLAYSMRKMTAQNTLVRKMHACETIGAATVICSDKTGTLTQNKMQVLEARFPALGGRSLKDAPAGSAAARYVDAISANSTAQLSRENGELKALGNPTEGALLVWLDGQGVNYLTARSGFAVGAQLPFSTERKFMATAGTDAAGGRLLHVKGAPEVVLGHCATVAGGDAPTPLTADARAAILDDLQGLQARGMRTLGLAYRDGVDVPAAVEGQVADLTWLGFVAIADPVRPEVPAAIVACRRAGLDVKIVTGDTPATAREIGRQIGLLTGEPDPDAEMTGAEFAALSDPEASRAAKKLKILARARPMDKLRLVRLLQDQREVVAVTGDGTNDAPALNYAKVGLAMGLTGTAVAKEAADVVLLDDSFGSIVTAVRWGRGLYENIQRFILFQLTINVVALGIALLGPFLGVNFPLTVMQMLWVNLIMDTFAALALATEPPNAGVLARGPRHPDAFIITPAMSRRIFGVGGLFLAILLGFLLYMPKLPGGVADDPDEKWWLTVFFSVFVLMQFWNLFNARCFGTTKSALRGVFDNPIFLGIAAVILVGQVVLVQVGGDVFRTVPLTAREWAVIIVGTSPVLLAGELLRFLARQREKITV